MTTRFTDLTEIAAVDVDDADVLALSDVSASASRKVTVSSLRTTVGAAELSQVQVEDDTSTVFGSVSGERLGQAIAVSREKSGTPVATTSGTAFDFTSIPAEVQEITVLLDGVSLSGTDNILIQIGTSGTPATTGYNASSTSATSSVGTDTTTSGFIIRCNDGGRTSSGVYTLTRRSPGENIWLGFGGVGSYGSSTAASFGGGRASIGGELDVVRITRSGTNTFDAGTANVRWK